MTTVLDTMGDSTKIHSPVGYILGVRKQMHPDVIAARNVSAAMVSRLLVLELLMAKSPIRKTLDAAASAIIHQEKHSTSFDNVPLFFNIVCCKKATRPYDRHNPPSRHRWSRPKTIATTLSDVSL